MKRLSIVILILIILQACSSKDKQAKKTVSFPVKVMAIKADKNPLTISFSGSILAHKTVNTGFMVSGKIQSVHVKKGDYVEKGEMLAKLDPTDYQYAVDAASAQFDRAKSEYNRLKSLYEKGSLTASDYEKIQALYKEAKADLKFKERQLRETRLEAPSEGWISFDRLEPGEIVKQGIPIFRIIRTKKVYARFMVPENEIGLIAKDMEVMVKVHSLGDTVFPARVEHIAPNAESFSRSFEVRALMNNDDSMIRPGMIARIEIESPSNKSQILIPAEAVLRNADGKTYVYLIRNNKARKQNVLLGEVGGKQVMVNEGLDPADTLVVEGQQKLYEKANINIIH